MSKLCDYFSLYGLVCKPIKNTDITQTVELINREYDYQDAYRNEKRTSFSHLRDVIRRDEFYVFKQDNIVVACVYVDLKEDNKASFGLLTVAKELQGHGLGNTIINSVEDYAKANSKKYVELGYMNISPWLKKYYEKLGYKETGEVWTWGHINVHVMSKSLA